MSQSVLGIVHTRLEAENLVNALRSAGLLESNISVLFPDKDGTKDFAHDVSSKAPEGAVTGGTAGGIIGGTLGLLAGVGALAIPGVGPLIAAGPIMAALSGVAVGATVGSVSGGLIGMGIPEYEAKVYEGRVRDGNILLAVHCRNGDEMRTAEDTFKKYDASDVHLVDDEAVKRN